MPEPASQTTGGSPAALRGTVAWVTGGGSGIGRACAIGLARQGATVAVSGRRREVLDGAVAEIRALGLAADAFALDVSDAAAIASTEAAVRERLGPVGVLVCCAGTNVANRGWSELTAADLRRVIDVNLVATAQTVLAVLPGMRALGGGVVIVVSSWAGWTHSPGAGAAYSASKTALGALVETVNDQEGRHGIRSCHLCPGEVDTEILRTRPVPPPDRELARMLRPADVAAAVTFVASSPRHMCVNELVITPTWNRSYIGIDEQP